jgi:hypothetical protein
MTPRSWTLNRVSRSPRKQVIDTSDSNCMCPPLSHKGREDPQTPRRKLPHLRNCGRFLAWYGHGSSSWSSDGETRGPRCIKHRGALFCLASAEDLAPTLARMSGLQQLIFKTLCALTCARPESRHDFRFVGDAGQRAAWQRSTLDPHRDPAPGKVIRSCPVASFDLLTKIDPADTISASAAHCLIKEQIPAARGS